VSNRVVVYWNKKIRSYDLKITDPLVTVADYEQALLNFSLRQRYHAFCLSCGLCCQGRIPLTLIDVYRMINSGVGEGLSVVEWVRRYAYVEFIGKCVDIVLKTRDDGFCRFLDPATLQCSIYEWRPLVCSTYFCSRFSKKARHLRSRIINQGEDELVRYLLAQGIARDDPRWFQLDSDDWKPNCFTGKTSYQEVPLRRVCSGKLWSQLIKKGCSY